MTLGHRIKAIVDFRFGEDRKLLARRMGVTVSAVGSWITGASDIKLRNLRRIAEIANVSLGWLASGEGDDPFTGEWAATHGAGYAPNIISVGESRAAGILDSIFSFVVVDPDDKAAFIKDAIVLMRKPQSPLIPGNPFESAKAEATLIFEHLMLARMQKTRLAQQIPPNLEDKDDAGK